LTPREQQTADALRALALELQTLGLAGIAAEVEELVVQGGAALAAAAQLLCHAAEAAESWTRAPEQWRTRVSEELRAATPGAARLAAEAGLERAAERVAAALAAASLEQAKRIALALGREIEAHPVASLRAELAGFLGDRLSLFGERIAQAACRQLEGDVAALREAHLLRVAPCFGDDVTERGPALQLVHGELGLLVGEAGQAASEAMAQALAHSSLSLPLPGAGEQRQKQRLCAELPDRVREAGRQLGARLSVRLRARVRWLAEELDRHTRAHHTLALGALAGAAQLDPERLRALRDRLSQV
jgi:hypothetical protein